MKRGSRRVCCLLAGCFFAWGSVSLAESGQRVLAVGDIHGAYEAFRSILLETELIDEAGHWSGGDAILVQTGDFLDRGADSIRVGLWLQELQAEASRAGGEVIVLMGNHEALNLMGDLRFVPPEMLMPLVDKDSKKRRLAMCQQRAAIFRQGAKALKQKASSAGALRDRCLVEVPLGLVEYQATLRPEHPFGSWLRSLPVVARVGDAIFLHGGLSPDMMGLSVDEINQQVRRELDTYEGWRRHLVESGQMSRSGSLMEMARAVHVQLALSEKQTKKGAAPDPLSQSLNGFNSLSNSQILRTNGPLWFRSYDTWEEGEGLEAMEKILKSLGARHVVTGHTPQEPRRIDCRFGGRVFLIDTGMLANPYKGVPAALQFQDGRVEGIYIGEREVFLGGDPTVAVSCN